MEIGKKGDDDSKLSRPGPRKWKNHYDVVIGTIIS